MAKSLTLSSLDRRWNEVKVHFVDGANPGQGRKAWRVLRGFGADAVFPVGGDEPDDEGEEDEFYAEVEAVEDFLEAGVGVPTVAELHADVGEGEAPGPGAEKGVEVEAALGHAGDAGGKGDKGSDDGEETAEGDGAAAVLLKELLGAVEVVAAEEEEAAEALDGGSASPVADPIGRDGAEVAADGAGGGDEEELGGGGAEDKAGEGHDDFGGEGDAGGFDGHEQGDAGEAAGGDDADDEGGEGG